MYSIFERLLNERGITAYKVSKDTGISTATLTDWKKGRSTPKLDKLQKISDYLGVTVNYLSGIEEPTTETPPLEDELIAFYGEVKRDLTEDDIDDLKVAMRAKAERNKKKKSGV